MYISRKLPGEFPSKLMCSVACMEDIKYVSLIEISKMVIKIHGVENGELLVPINNTLVHQHGFLGR